MISVYTILLLCVCSSGAAKSGGGILLKIGQHGLNEAISYVMDNVLIPYLENDLNIQTFNIPLGAATILIEKLGLHTLEGQHGMVNILDDNKISIKVGFSKIGLKANLTRVAPDDNIFAPDTVVFFTDCNLKVIFSLGLGEKKDGVTLDSCKAAIGSFSAKGTLGAALEGLFLIGGSASIASLVEQICPYLENITNENLDDILSVQDTVKISTRKYGDLSVNMKLVSASTQAKVIEMKAEVTTGADSFVGNVSFPGHSRRKTSRAANLLINDILLGEVFKYAIQVDVFKGFELQTTIGKNNYTIQVNETSIQSRLTSSSEGVSVILNVTFNVYTEYQCLGYRLTMDTVTPLVLGLNNTLIQVETDKYRLQKHFTVSYWNKTCLQNIEKLGESKNVQWEILSQTNSEYEKRLIGQSFELKLPKGKWYGFKEPCIDTLKGGVVFSSGLRFGNVSEVVEEALKHKYNQHYKTNVTVYIYSDGEKITFDGRKPTVAAGVIITLNVNLLASSIIVFLFFSKYFDC